MKINEVTKKIEPSKPRNFVAKNMTTSGAGAHKDKKKAEKQGDVKHKGKQYELSENENFNEYQQMIRKIENAMWQLHQHGRSADEIAELDHKIADHLRIDLQTNDMFAHAFHKAYNNFIEEIESEYGEYPSGELGEDGEPMKIKAVSGTDVTIDQGGQEIKTTADALTPGQQPGTFAMKPADPNQLKPGATVTDTPTAESDDQDQIFQIAPDQDGIHPEDDVDLMGSGHNHDIGGDGTDDFINDVRDAGFEKANKPNDVQRIAHLAGLR